MYFKKKDGEIISHIESYGHLTNTQCNNIFYDGEINGYKAANRRLNILCKNKYFKKYRNKPTEEYIYYLNKIPSPHSIYRMNFYSNLIKYNANVLDFKKEFHWKEKDKSRFADGYIEFSYKNQFRPIFIEVDFTHNTDIEKYEKLYGSHILQQEYKSRFGEIGENTFPYIYIIRANVDNLKYNGFLNVIFLDYRLNNFLDRVLLI